MEGQSQNRGSRCTLSHFDYHFDIRTINIGSGVEGAHYVYSTNNANAIISFLNNSRLHISQDEQRSRGRGRFCSRTLLSLNRLSDFNQVY